MVAYSRATDGACRLQPLNRPAQVQVEADEQGQPLTVYLSNRRLAVAELIEDWRIDDEWWRERPISRLYHRLLLEDGRTVDVFEDLTNGRWSRQAY